ncbi:MAG TPA: DUF2061 domain-containing protein [Candidatus Levybacteria bacterium]|nr:DUF2061 domain-containing protein [Candidatus Levybacteria bacterium]
MAFRELNQRSIVKTITYRFLIILSNFTITYLLTKSFTLATSVAGVSFVINTLIYYFHERIWNTVRWGKKKQ